METINRLTRAEYSKLIKSILDGEVSDDRFVVEEVDGGFEMTVSEASGAPVPVLCGSYHGGIIERMPISEADLAIWRANGVNEERILDFVISTGATDRYGDIVRPSGLNKKNFRRNPVVLWAHEYYGLPIAKSLREMREGKEVKGSSEFIDATLYEFADTVFRFYRSGFLNAVSIGFQPIKKKVIKDDDKDSWWPKYDFIEWDLLEYSAVPVPANPEAIIDAKSAGIEEQDLGPYRSWLERHLDACESGSCRRGIASKRNVETTWSKLYGKTSSTIVVPGPSGNGDDGTDVEVPAGFGRAVKRLQSVVDRFEKRSDLPDEIRDDVTFAGELLADLMAAGLGELKTDGDDPPEDWRDKFVTDEDFNALIARVDALEDYVADAKGAADPGSSPGDDDPVDDGSSPDGDESTEGVSAAEAGEAVEQIFSEE